jgi:hypothetical protein
MKEAILIIVGALISCGTTFFLDWIKCTREEKRYYKRKREETYVEMQDYITDLNAHWAEVKNNYLSTELRLKYNALRSKSHIYGKKDITELFYGLTSDLMAGKRECNYQERNEQLINMIKQDLKIEE